MIRANTAESLRAGLQLPLATYRIYSSSFPSLSSNQDLKINLVQNTELHRAVANRQFELINTIVKDQPYLITIKNNQGETAADWFQEYIKNFLIFEEPQQIEELPEKIKEGNIEFLEDYLKNGFLIKLRFADGNTLMHIAVQYAQFQAFKLICQYTTVKDLIFLLEMQNIHGINPEVLATQLKNYDILEFIQSKKTLFKDQSIEDKKLTDYFCHPIPISLLKKISKKLLTIKNESDFHKFTPELMNLCIISYLICNQSLEVIERGGSALTKSENLLKILFNENFNTYDKLRLQENIHRVSHYFKELIQKNEVHQVINLSTQNSSIGCSNITEKSIYLNLLQPNIDIANLIATMIHEASHVINFSFDIKYCKKIEKNGWMIRLVPYSQLQKKITTLKVN